MGNPAPADPATPAAPEPGSNPQDVTIKGAPGAPADPAPDPGADPGATPKDKPPATPLAPDSPDDPAKPRSKAPAAPEPDFPDNWREKLAGGDEKKLAKLKRYPSPQAFTEAYFHAQGRLSKGEAAKVLGENPTEEEVKEFREVNGIPEKAADYKIELDDGLVVGEADKPWVEKALEDFHARNYTPSMVNETLNTYFRIQQEQLAVREDTDIEQKVGVEETLRKEFGNEYRGNVNAVAGMLEMRFGEEGMQKLMRVRDQETGDLLLNDVGFMRSLVQLAVDLNPAGTVVPGHGANAAQVVTDEITQIEVEMAKPEAESKYWSGPEAARMQERYRALVDARDRMKAATPKEQG